MVYVISKSGKPLMPCENVIARLLLDSGMARVKRREPFTIKLTHDTTNYIQPLILGVDCGSNTAGFAVSDINGGILYLSEVILRNDIKYSMDQRKMFRNSRRIRHTRYRKVRHDNRKNLRRKGRLNPSIKSKIDAHIKEVNFIRSILPILEHIICEMGHFNVAAMKNPALLSPKVSRWGYKRGFSYGFENIKAAVRARDNYTCQVCGGKHKDRKLEVHHIIPRSRGGSDDPNNLITLCSTCHKNIHNNKIHKDFVGVARGPLVHATHMNIIRSQLLKRYNNIIETWGYVTALDRKKLGFDKSTHWLDAVIIATEGRMPIFKVDVVYIKRCHSRGEYKRSSGRRSNIRIPKGKVCGFLRYDKVKYMDKFYFIKGRATQTKTAILMDIYGKTVKFSYIPKGNQIPKLRNITRITARSSWMIWTKKIDCATI